MSTVNPLDSQQTASQEAQIPKEGYVYRSLVGLDQFVNVLAGGHPDETISARSARAAEQGKLWGKAMCKFLNVFERNHGALAVAGDAERAEIVEELENKSKLVTPED